MLRVELPFLNYHRVLIDNSSDVDYSELKKDDYSFIVAYGNFYDLDYHLTEKKACVIDLSEGIEKVIQNFSPTSRNEVRRADKIKELEFHFGLESFDFYEYFDFHRSCEKDRNWYPVPPNELKNSLVFSATFEGQLISGMSCYSHGNRIRVGRIYSNKRSKLSDRLTNLVYGVAAKRIILKICEFAYSNGIISLDLGGVDLNDLNKSGITKFKMSMGGEIVPVMLARYYSTNFSKGEQQIKALGWDLT